MLSTTDTFCVERRAGIARPAANARFGAIRRVLERDDVSGDLLDGRLERIARAASIPPGYCLNQSAPQ